VSVFAGFLGWGFIVLLCNLFWKTPSKLYTELNQKYQIAIRKVDDRNWDYINVAGQDFVDGSGEFIGYSIELKNGKTRSYCFRMEFKYLELDGKKKVDEKRVPIWVSGGLAKQGVIKEGVSLESTTTGAWWLFRIIGGGNNRKNAIVYGRSNDQSAAIPKEEYDPFSSFARGEVEIFGTYIVWDLPKGLGREMNLEPIYGSSIYNFRIDIIDGKPTLKFNKGPLEFYAVSESQETDNGTHEK
jgi:hypothetical protein